MVAAGGLRLRLLAIVLGALAAVPASQPAWGASEVHLADDSLLGASSPAPQRGRPVLFVHGHNLADANDSDLNYQKNWHLGLNNLPSFKQALDLSENAWLDLEPYYIRLQDQNRSIVEDAREIGDAVERILARHDPAYTPFTATPSTAVKVALIAYSKGTISARLYLKSLQQQQFDLPAPRPGFNPVSEFVAISPPNHGLAAGVITAFSLALKQLNNGYRDDCSQYLLNGDSLDFIRNLNGHAIQDTQPPSPPDPSWAPGQFPGEAPGSRPNGDPVPEGTLYVTIYADANRDLVGGSTPSNDCQGRILARNLAPDAVFIEVPEIPGGQDGGAVHQNTVHTPEVICLALSTVVHHKAPAADFRCPIPGQLPRIPPRAAVIQVLDISGSMLSPACSTCAPKLDVLKDAVELFVQLWSVTAGPGDRIGATYFGTQVAPFAPAGDPLLELSAANVAAMIADVRARTTVSTNLTAMGGGLQSPLETLQGPGTNGIPQRHIILFTDGMQNVNPMVVRVDDSPPPGAFHLEIANVVGRPPSNVNPSQPPRRLDAALGLKVHTLGVGATAQFVDLLAEIAQQTNGTTRITMAPDQDLRQFFAEEVIESLQGNSPQLLAYRRSRLAGKTTMESFPVGRGARRIVLKLSWSRPQRLNFLVEKDGRDVSALGRFIEGPFYRIFVLDLPAGAAGARVGSEGHWRMRITGQGGAGYEAAAIVDEPKLAYSVSLVRKIHSVGEPLEINAKISVDGLPVTRAREVVATIFKPGESVGNLLSRNPSPPGPARSSIEGGGPASDKLQRLLLDDRIQRRLRPVAKTVRLKSRGDGTYSGTFTETTIPGAYRIVVTLEGKEAESGHFRRTGSLTAVVRFGTADRARSQLQVTEIQRNPDGRHLRLTLRPRDRHGNYLGPDHASRLKVLLAPGSLEGAPQDEGDGRYTVPLFVPQGIDPKIAITVMDHILFAGKLSRLERSSKPASAR